MAEIKIGIFYEVLFYFSFYHYEANMHGKHVMHRWNEDYKTFVSVEHFNIVNNYNRVLLRNGIL